MTPIRRLAISSAQVWRGQLSLYRAAYGLGGIGGALGSAIGDYVLDLSSHGGAFQWILFVVVGLGELAFAWVCVVATWRAARWRSYGIISVGFATAFVWVQFVFTAAWIGCSGLAGLGLAVAPITIAANNVFKPEIRALLPPSDRAWSETLLRNLIEAVDGRGHQ